MHRSDVECFDAAIYKILRNAACQSISVDGGPGMFSRRVILKPTTRHILSVDMAFTQCPFKLCGFITDQSISGGACATTESEICDPLRLMTGLKSPQLSLVSFPQFHK